MPVLSRPSDSETYLIINVEVSGTRLNSAGQVVDSRQHVQFVFNAQHDCATARCTDSKRVPRRQERVDLDETDPAIEHQPLEVYLVNTHALHNAHLLRRAMPRNLIAPVPCIDPDQRKAKHAQLAAEWRENPKSYTARERAKEEKQAEDATRGKGKKGRGKKCSGGEGDPAPKEEVKAEMVLFSELGELDKAELNH